MSRITFKMLFFVNGSKENDGKVSIFTRVGFTEMISINIWINLLLPDSTSQLLFPSFDY